MKVTNIDLKELGEIYEEVRLKLLEEAEKRNLYPEYAYENESGIETPERFSFAALGITIPFRDTKLFEKMVRGNLDELKELLDTPEIFNQFISDVFGGYDEWQREIQKALEEESAKEAA